jgi:hypothetical protein
MHGAREAMDGGISHIEEQVKGIEQAVIENPGLAFDLAKTIIESTCKTVLAQRGIPFSTSDDLPKLFRTATQNLPFLPASASSDIEARKSLARTLSGLHTDLQGVCELRNTHGYAAHGVEAERVSMSNIQALLAAQTADTIVGFLHRVHREDRPTSPGPSLEFSANAEFNQYVDDANMPIEIFGLAYRSSEVLFQLDRPAYVDHLNSYAS